MAGNAGTPVPEPDRGTAGLPSCTTGQLPEGENAFAQGGSGCRCEQHGNMADMARPAQQLLVSNTLGLIHPNFTPRATLKVTSPTQAHAFQQPSRYKL